MQPNRPLRASVVAAWSGLAMALLVVPSIERAQFETRLCGGLLVAHARDDKRLLVRGSDRDESRELQFGIAGDKFGLSLQDGRLGTPVTCTDSKACA